MSFGVTADESTARTMVDICLDAGVTLFDTANSYAAGESERLLGSALAGRRDEVLISTKGFYPVGDGLEPGGSSAAQVASALDNSLRRLGTDYVDYYLLHGPDRSVPIEETLEALETARRAGKIRFPAVSNFAAWRIAEMRAVAEREGWEPVTQVQVPYNLISRRIEGEYLEAAEHFGLQTMAYNPLAGGLLSGRYGSASAAPDSGRFGGELAAMYHARYWSEAQLRAVDRLREAAAGAGLTLVELAYRWLLSRPFIASVLVGAASPEQLRSNLATPGPLPADVAAECDLVWDDLEAVAEPYYR